MARIRSVKPELRTSLTASTWPVPVRYLWVLLWGYLDDHGRGVDEPRLIKADCLPLDDDVSVAAVDSWLAMMAASIDGQKPSVCRYEVGGRRFLHAVSWTDHQRPQHPKDSRIPPCPRDHDTHAERSSPDASTQPEKSSGGLHEVLTPEVEGVVGEVVGGGGVVVAVRRDVESVCDHLANRIESNGSRRPPVTDRWKDAARLLLDKDTRTEAEIHAAVDWCQDDEFWRSVILSFPKLREKFDQMRLQAEKPHRRPTPQDDTDGWYERSLARARDREATR